MTAAFLRLNRRTFASLRHRNYRLFFVGQTISVTGAWMQNVAMAWLVLELTGSPFAVGILVLCQFLPFSVLGLFAGVFADRLDPRRLVITTQAAAMVVATLLAVLTLLGNVEPWQVYVLAVLRGMVLVFDAPARQAFTYQMVGPAELPNADCSQLVALQRRPRRRARYRRRDRGRLRARLVLRRQCRELPGSACRPAGDERP